MIKNDRNNNTFRLSKSLNLFATNSNTNCYWRLTMLDEKRFPTIICALNHTTDSTIIKIFDTENIPELIVEFNLSKKYNAAFHQDAISSIYCGLNYGNGVLTFMEKLYPDSKNDSSDSNWNIHKVTRYLLSNEKEKIKNTGSYVINGDSGTVYDDRLFCTFPNGVNIYNVLDGRLIESLSLFSRAIRRIATKKLVVLESKTQIILYCTVTDRKNIIEKQINGVSHYGDIIYPTRPNIMERRENSEITELGDNHIAITMHTENKTQHATLLYKLIEDTNVDEKDQCCVCFHFTEKNMALIPCGHTQFCENCIGLLKKCPLCDNNITYIQPIYK